MNREPDYWQCAPCPKCGQNFYAVPWEPQGFCSSCDGRVPLTVVAVYIPTRRAAERHLEQSETPGHGRPGGAAQG